MTDTPKERKLTEKEITKRRDETLKRMLKTPPKPHSEMTGQRTQTKQSKGKSKDESRKRQSGKAAK